MDYSFRREIFKKIEEKRKRPLIAYVTSIRPGSEAQMTQDMIPEFIKHINKISANSTKNGIDILIISYGGDPIVSWRVISLLREKFPKVGILIPYTAYSAATLLALGADEILMHPYGNLGPLDPQISIRESDGNVKMVAYENIIKYLEFVKDVGITDQELLQRTFDKLTNEINPTVIGYAKRSSQLALSMGEKLLGTHMKDKGKAKAISEMLNTKFYHHGYPLGRAEAKDLGLNISNRDKYLEELMWQLYESYMIEFEFNSSFDLSKTLSEEIVQLKDPVIDKQYTVVRESKVMSIESNLLNSFVKNSAIIKYAIKEDTSIVSNTIYNVGSWETIEEDLNVDN